MTKSSKRVSKPQKPAKQFKVGHVCTVGQHKFVVKTRQATTDSHKRVKYWSRVAKAKPTKLSKLSKKANTVLKKRKLAGGQGDEHNVYVDLFCGSKTAKWRVKYDDDGIYYAGCVNQEGKEHPSIWFPHASNGYRSPTVIGGFFANEEDFAPRSSETLWLVPSMKDFVVAVNKKLGPNTVFDREYKSGKPGKPRPDRTW